MSTPQFKTRTTTFQLPKSVSSTREIVSPTKNVSSTLKERQFKTKKPSYKHTRQFNT